MSIIYVLSICSSLLGVINVRSWINKLWNLKSGAPKDGFFQNIRLSAAKTRFTQSKFRMLHLLHCVVLVTFAREKKEREPLFKQTLKVTFHIITSLWVVFGLSTPISYVENTFKAMQSTFTSLEMHSKRRYKRFICSVIVGELKSFRNFKLQGLQYYFSENFRCNQHGSWCNLTFYESKNFSDSSLHHILETKNFRFPFSMKNSVTWVAKYEKLNFWES